MPRFCCPYCSYCTRHSSNVRSHIRRMHHNQRVYVVDIIDNQSKNDTRFVPDITGPFTVYGVNVGIGDGQGQNYGKLWSRTSSQTDIDNNYKKKFPCPNCACAYSQKYSLNRHLTYECGQEPRFKCPHCEYRCKKSANVYEHVRRRHKNCQVYAIDVLKATEHHI
ncbi:longitudinals lacking protein, isoforms A/B/D/L-like [Apis dorsata]|uniref:longitudinals lacking protein, isoforms A/B/D/L-like n=1 Tax=Apis dorsata TaxID=7462 RepID=UPI001293D4B9|nr:longitudinals lacking protein, isoforms A/B/D/L-like [Apis dorsata]